MKPLETVAFIAIALVGVGVAIAGVALPIVGVEFAWNEFLAPVLGVASISWKGSVGLLFLLWLIVGATGSLVSAARGDQ